MADNTQKIADLEAIQETGASFVSVDGVQVTYNHDAIDRKLRALRENDDTQSGRRPTNGRIKLS